jgi:pimeloyl-ACP methyl ester carboxylesterase
LSGCWFRADAREATAFAPHTTVLLVDPPGMGGSDLLPSELGVDFLADCLEQVLDEHGIQRANVVAASYGTPSAVALAAKSPERIDRVKPYPIHVPVHPVTWKSGRADCRVQCVARPRPN